MTSSLQGPTWTNWVGNQSFSPSAMIEVTSEAEIAALVARSGHGRAHLWHRAFVHADH